MYSTVALNENNDIYLDSSGNIAMFYGILAIQQLCLNAVKTALGELRYSVTQGLPDFQSVWNGNPNIGQFEFSLRKSILSVPGVLEVVSLNTSIEGTVLSYFIEILTTIGSTNLQGSENV